MPFSAMKVSSKLLLSFACILSLIVLMSVFSIAQMTQVKQTAEDIEDVRLPKVREALEIKALMMRLRAQVLNHLLQPTDAEKSVYEKKMERTRQLLTDVASKYEKLLSTPEDQSAYEALISTWKEYLVEHEKTLALSRENKTPDAMAVVHGKAEELRAKLDALIDQMSQKDIDASSRATQKGQQLYAASRNGILAIFITCFAFGVCVSMAMTRSLTKQLGGEPADAAQTARKIANGDLVRVAGGTEREKGSLMSSMQTMLGSLAAIVTQVRSGTRHIAIASGEISSGNADLSARTERQASSLEETASSMEEFASVARTNLEHTRQANTLVNAATDVTVKGREVVSEVLENMNSINQRAHKISGIVDAIDQIAFQTNILALNAAVEAARAGEKGRGFAVVASDVKGLAERATNAAKQIKALIDESSDRVDRGCSMVNQAGATMAEIERSVQLAAKMIDEIASASQAQYTGIEQVAQSISGIDVVTQQNAALVEEATAASAMLKDEADRLASLVEYFKLDSVG